MAPKKNVKLNSILVISPHPDDETLGAGGTLLKYNKLGHKIYWLNLTNMKEEFGFKAEEIAKRRKEIEKVMCAYRFAGFFDLGLKPAGLDTYEKKFLTEKIAEAIDRVKPYTLIIPNKTDVHSDHRIAFEAAYSSAKVFRRPFIKEILAMEIPSQTTFSFDCCGSSPTHLVDISDYFEKKMRIMSIYASELKKHPFPRSRRAIEALATLRGVQAGCRHAEAFCVLRRTC